MTENKKKIAAIIQARMTSTRLPGKVLMDIEGKSMLWHVVNRLKFSKKLDDIILAISNTKESDVLEEFAKKNNIKYFRGSEQNVLLRYYETAKKFKCDVIMRITADCPLIDPKIVDLVIEKHLNSGADYTSNILQRTFPRGLDAEIFNLDTLKKSHNEAKENYQREHVTPYIYEHPRLFKINHIKNEKDLSHMRWTVDEKEDLDFVRQIYKRLFKKGKIFSMEEIVALLKKEPRLLEINKGIKRKPL